MEEDKLLEEFLRESNAIEREYSKEALQDSKQAWMCGYISFVDEPLSVDLILAIHRRLLKRLNPKIAGKIRDVPVMIGGEVRSQSKSEIKEELTKWCEKWNKRKFALPASMRFYTKEYIDGMHEGFVKRMHVAFELIHPFEDGNGRTGRILMNLQRLKLGLPLLVIHEGKEQMEYYKWFKEKNE
jgi:Fic family protein